MTAMVMTATTTYGQNFDDKIREIRLKSDRLIKEDREGEGDVVAGLLTLSAYAFPGTGSYLSSKKCNSNKRKVTALSGDAKDGVEHFESIRKKFSGRKKQKTTSSKKITSEKEVLPKSPKKKRRVHFPPTIVSSTHHYFKEEDEVISSWYKSEDYLAIADVLQLTINAYRIFEAKYLIEEAAKAKNKNSGGDAFDNLPSVYDIGKSFEEGLRNFGLQDTDRMLCTRGLERRLEHREIRNQIDLRRNLIEKLVINNSKHCDRIPSTPGDDQQEKIGNFYKTACESFKLEAIRKASKDEVEAFDIYNKVDSF
jgi:hypothetical protein